MGDQKLDRRYHALSGSWGGVWRAGNTECITVAPCYRGSADMLELSRQEPAAIWCDLPGAVCQLCAPEGSHGRKWINIQRCASLHQAEMNQLYRSTGTD